MLVDVVVVNRQMVSFAGLDGRFDGLELRLLDRGCHGEITSGVSTGEAHRHAHTNASGTSRH